MSAKLKRRKPEKVLLGENLYILWKDGYETRLDFYTLRCLCPCAACVDEFTGERKLEPRSVAPDVRPKNSEYVGNYALRFMWSDGHDTGIYTFRTLRELSEQQTQVTPTET